MSLQKHLGSTFWATSLYNSPHRTPPASSITPFLMPAALLIAARNASSKAHIPQMLMQKCVAGRTQGKSQSSSAVSYQFSAQACMQVHTYTYTRTHTVTITYSHMRSRCAPPPRYLWKTTAPSQIVTAGLTCMTLK